LPPLRPRAFLLAFVSPRAVRFASTPIPLFAFPAFGSSKQRSV